MLPANRTKVFSVFRQFCYLNYEPYPDGLQNAGVAQLLCHFAGFEALRSSHIIWLYASDELRCTRDHFLQQIHQRETEVGRQGLLCPTLGSQTAAIEALLVAKINYRIN